MDDRLVPMMLMLSGALALGIGWVLYSTWRRRRAVAWNVVNAAMTLRAMSAAQVAALEQSALAADPRARQRPAMYLDEHPHVRLALLADQMRRQGLPPFDPAHPFRPLASPLLARSVGAHVRTLQLLLEARDGVTLAELDPAPAHPRR